MNLTEQKIRQKAAQYAKVLLKRAHAHEPGITADLQKTALEVAAEMIGLEHKFKSEESLTRKIAENSIRNVRKLLELEYFLEEAIAETIETKARDINDYLRYTFVFSDENYVFGFKSSLQKLKQNNFTVPENKIWNAWKNIGTLFDKGYRGINITIFSSQGQIFELQFHTEASFKLKTETHFFYEELRIRKTARERKNEIVQKLLKVAQAVSVPKGVKKL